MCKMLQWALGGACGCCSVAPLHRAARCRGLWKRRWCREQCMGWGGQHWGPCWATLAGAGQEQRLLGPGGATPGAGWLKCMGPGMLACMCPACTRYAAGTLVRLCCSNQSFYVPCCHPQSPTHPHPPFRALSIMWCICCRFSYKCSPIPGKVEFKVLHGWGRSAVGLLEDFVLVPRVEQVSEVQSWMAEAAVEHAGEVQPLQWLLGRVSHQVAWKQQWEGPLCRYLEQY